MSTDSSTDPRPSLPATRDEHAAALSAEFWPFQVWVNLRAAENGGGQFHARRPGWTALDIISAPDATAMRDALIVWQRQHPDS